MKPIHGLQRRHKSDKVTISLHSTFLHISPLYRISVPRQGLQTLIGPRAGACYDLHMITDCPRCGFSQPKDRYCANCGLDIDHFKPVPKPKLKALAQNTFVQITLVAVVVLALASGIYTAQQKAIQSQLETAHKQEMQAPAPTTTPVADETPAATPAAATTGHRLGLRAAAPSGISEEEAAAAVANENKAWGEGASELATDTIGAVGATAKAAGMAAPPKSLSVYFLEVPQATIDQLASENQILNEQAGVTSIMIAGQPSPSALGSNIVLPGGGSRALETNKKVDLRFMNPTGTGMQIEINHTYHNDQEFELDVTAQIRLRTMTDQNTSDTGVNGKYTIPKNATLLIVGMVPRQPVGQEDQSYFSRTPLAIMASPQFQSTQSQFVVVIQPK